MEIEWDIGTTVKVKLTQSGIEELLRAHEAKSERIRLLTGNEIGPLFIEVDDDGYTRFQGWQLMNHFGHLMTLTAGVPFESKIIILECRAVPKSEYRE